MINDYWTALALGFVGSIHCIGMCGPIAISLPGTAHYFNMQYALNRVLYNLGRIITYAVLGAVMGAVGHAIILAGYQQSLSITLGAVLLLSLALPARWSRRFTGRLTFFSSHIQSRFRALFRQRGGGAFLLIGLLNGLLPCGMVYVALAGASATGGATAGLTYMVFFGLGTVPALLTIALMGRLLRLRFGRLMPRMIPVATFLLAIILILRGLSLGIPWVSPKISATPSASHQHHMAH